MARSRTKITFDDYQAVTGFDSGRLPDIYHQLHWENMAGWQRHTAESDFSWIGGGGYVGSKYGAFATIAAPGPNETFSLKRMLAGSPTSDEVALTIRGFRDGVEIASWQGVLAEVETPLSFGKRFNRIDALQIEATKSDSVGGTVDANVLMDNLVLTSNDIVW